MSAQSQLLSAAFVGLSEFAGELLTFRGASVRGLVNRDPFARTVRTPDFDPRDASVISLAASAITPVPATGEYFIDAAGLRHRVETVQRIDHVLHCSCVVSSAA
jgi:hypothetical protein